MKRLLSLSLTGAILFSGCAKKAEDIQASYVSPIQYENFSCEQLEMEMHRLSAKVTEVADKQNKSHTRDVVATTVGMVVFWPALFFLVSGDQEEELKRLKGEYEALQSAAVRKNCIFLNKKESNETVSMRE